MRFGDVLLGMPLGALTEFHPSSVSGLEMSVILLGLLLMIL
jgi:hypothetical protein